MKACLLVLAYLVAATIAPQDTALDAKFDQELPALISTYKTLHAAPELSSRRPGQDGPESLFSSPSGLTKQRSASVSSLPWIASQKASPSPAGFPRIARPS
jgi:hypothetical protein